MIKFITVGSQIIEFHFKNCLDLFRFAFEYIKIEN